MENDTFISFYLKSSRIHIFVDSLRALGNPRRICLMVNESGDRLLIRPYQHRDLKSHKVPLDVYVGADRMEISSMKLCRLFSAKFNWDLNRSYRVPGKAYPDSQVAVFFLLRAEPIEYGMPGNAPPYK